MLLYEEGDALVLGAGIPEEWVSAKNGMSIRDIPTHFGRVSYRMQKIDGNIHVAISGEADPPGGIVLKSPLDAPISQVTLNSKPWQDFSADEIVIENLPAEVVITY